MTEQKNIILVAGATGRTGQAVVHRLIKNQSAKGEIRVLARNRDSAQKLFGDQVEIFQGNVAQADAVKSALANVTHVFYLTGPSLKDSTKEAEQGLVWGLRNIINEGKKLALKHVILLCADLVNKPFSPFSVILDTFLPGIWKFHLAQERMLRASGLNYTIVRPPRLGDGEVIPEEVDIAPNDCKKYFITRAALAEFMVRCINNPTLPQKTTLGVWGEKKKLSDNFNWSEVFRKAQADFDDLPPQLEKQHDQAKKIYGFGLFLVISASLYFVLKKYFL